MSRKGRDRAFEGANQEYIRRSLGLVRLDGHALADPGTYAWHCHGDCALAGRAPGAPRSNELGDFVASIPICSIDVASHRPGMGHQHLPARTASMVRIQEIPLPATRDRR